MSVVLAMVDTSPRMGLQVGSLGNASSTEASTPRHFSSGHWQASVYNVTVAAGKGTTGSKGRYDRRAGHGQLSSRQLSSLRTKDLSP